MCRCKDHKVNPSHVMWLVRVVVLKIFQPSLLSSSSCHLKKESQPCFGQKLYQRIHSHHHSWTAKFECTIDFEQAFIRNSSNQKKILYHMWNLREGHRLWNLHEGLGLLMVSNSFVQHVGWEMFSPSRFESFISISSHAKCVNNQGTKLSRINLQKYWSMVTKYFSSHSQNERLMHPKYIAICWWQGLHATNYGLIFCVTIMSLCSTINHVCTLDRSNIFLNLGVD